MSTLKGKTSSGILWTSIQRFTSMGLSFVSGIILARLLSPDDFGCIGMLNIFMVIANTFIDGGFASALLQKKRPTQEDYSTIFFWNLGMAIFMYLLLFFTAPLIAKFYGIELLCPVLRVQGIVLILNAFLLIQNNQLRKQFEFKKIAIVTLAASILSLAITIYMAYAGFGVWALVAQNIFSTFIPTIIYWFTNKWKPILCFSKQSFHELFGFGAFMFLTNILNSLTNNVQGLLIGRYYNPATMGYYSKAHSTEIMASGSVSQIMAQITMPVYSEVQNDLSALGNIIKRMTMTVAYITFPIMFFLCLLAKPLFILLYSATWIPSVPYFHILCVAGLAICLQAVNLQAIAAIGKSKLMFKWTVIKNVAGLVALVFGLIVGGMWGLLGGMVFQAWFSYIVNAALVSKHVGYNLWMQFRDLLPILLLSLASFIVALLIVRVIEFNTIIESVIQGITFISLFLGGSILLRLDAYTYCRDTMMAFLRKRK